MHLFTQHDIAGNRELAFVEFAKPGHGAEPRSIHVVVFRSRDRLGDGVPDMMAAIDADLGIAAVAVWRAFVGFGLQKNLERFRFVGVAEILVARGSVLLALLGNYDG